MSDSQELSPIRRGAVALASSIFARTMHWHGRPANSQPASHATHAHVGLAVAGVWRRGHRVRVALAVTIEALPDVVPRGGQRRDGVLQKGRRQMHTQRRECSPPSQPRYAPARRRTCRSARAGAARQRGPCWRAHARAPGGWPVPRRRQEGRRMRRDSFDESWQRPPACESSRNVPST